MASTHIALLRGINVGGKNKLPMKDLKQVFAELGCRAIRTYIQSGNVVFEASAAEIQELSQRLTTALHLRFGFQVPVVLRSADELDEIARRNPFLSADSAPEALHVAFLAALPDPQKADGLDSQRSPGDTFSVRGREIYLHCPSGLARTKLTNAYFDARLGTTSTIRNWKTVLKLQSLARDPT